MTGYRLAITVVTAACLTGPAHATFGLLSDGPNIDVNHLNRGLRGHVDDYTGNAGQDRRFWSASLGQKRDVYVYTPPGYDPDKRYPVVFWMHGVAQDEKTFLELAPTFDKLMADGIFPKCVMVAADASPRGRASYFDAGTFYLNSPLGRYEDYFAVDVWNFVVERYSIRTEREAHVLAGASMGGFGAYNLGIKYRDRYGVLVGIMPALNTRYEDCRGRHDTDFNPNCFRFSERYNPGDALGRFGPITIRARRLISPVFGEGPATVAAVAAQNPTEMLFTHDVKPGEFEMFAGYGTEDEFNFDAHVQSFAYFAEQRGIDVTTYAVRGGRHNRDTGFKMLEPFAQWVRPRLEKYSPK